MTPSPHQQRVIEEKEQLDDKAKKLSQFIGESSIFPTLDYNEQERLRIQNDLMWQYSEILGQRISAFQCSNTSITEGGILQPGYIETTEVIRHLWMIGDPSPDCISVQATDGTNLILCCEERYWGANSGGYRFRPLRREELQVCSA